MKSGAVRSSHFQMLSICFNLGHYFFILPLNLFQWNDTAFNLFSSLSKKYHRISRIRWTQCGDQRGQVWACVQYRCFREESWSSQWSILTGAEGGVLLGWRPGPGFSLGPACCSSLLRCIALSHSLSRGLNDDLFFRTWWPVVWTHVCCSLL